MGERGSGHRRRAVWAWFVVCIGLAGCRSQVVGGLDEPRANEVLASLERHGLSADKEATGAGDDATFAVSVSSGELGRAVAVLRDESLPRDPSHGLLATYGEPGLVPSATEETARFDAAVSAELGATLERIPGVRAARVHVARPIRQPGLLETDPGPARASVLLTHAASQRPDEAAVRRLVAGAVEGLGPDGVQVVCVVARETASGTAGLRRVGPFLVAARSATPLGLTLALGLLGYAGLALAVVRARRPA